ncbi:MAG TPA: hypothetical protein VN613_02430 [Gemmatimonadaceae bacterium]|nr:hypothetical protein [Gemmatimonadaceae bacterium]
MILLFGPCMLVAPFLVVLIPVAIVLWPPVLAILGVIWLIVWPFAVIGKKMELTGIVRAHAALSRWFIVLLRPWRYFDVPVKKPEDPKGPV